MMNARRPQTPQAGHGTFMQSVEWLANLVAILIAFFATPAVHDRTIGFVLRFTHIHYSSGFDGAVDLIWWITCFLVVFCFCRMTISTVIIMGGLGLASRLL